MSFQEVVRQNDGVVAFNVGTGAPVNPVQSQGMLIDSDGAIYSSVDAVDHHENGLPFDADSRLCIEEAVIDHYWNGLPFTASGALAVASDTGMGGHYAQGIHFEDGGIGGSGLSPPLDPASLIAVYANTGTSLALWYDMTTTPWTLIAANKPIQDFSNSGSGAYQDCDVHDGENLIAFASDGNPSTNPDLEYWDMTTYPYTKLGTYSNGAVSECSAVKFNRSGEYLAAAFPNVVRVFVLPDLTTPFRSATSAGASHSIDFNANNSLMAVGCANSPFYIVHNLITASNITVPAAPDDIQSVIFHPTDPDILFTLCQTDGLLRVINVATATVLHTRSFTAGKPLFMKLSRDGTKLALLLQEIAGMRVFDVTSGNDPAGWTDITVNNPPTGTISNSRALAWAANDAYILTEGNASEDQLAFSVGATIDRITAFGGAAMGTCKTAFVNTPPP